MKSVKAITKNAQRIDTGLAVGFGLAALTAWPLGWSTAAGWLAVGALISALAAYTAPAARLAGYIERNHIRSPR